MSAVRYAAAMAAAWVIAAAPHQGPSPPTMAERAAFRRSLVAESDSGVLRWQPLRGATGYEVLSSRDARRYRLEDLVTGDRYRPEPARLRGRLWFRVVAMRAQRALPDTTVAVPLDPHGRGG